MLTSNVAEAYGFVRTDVADRTGAPEALPDIEIIFATAPYVGEGLVPLPAEGLTVGAILLRPRSRGTIRLASADPSTSPSSTRATSPTRTASTSRRCSTGSPCASG